MRGLSLDNKVLYLAPVKLCTRKACLFSSLSFLVLEEEDANEELEEEETSYQDEYDEEGRVSGTVLVLGTIVYFCNINGLVHNVRPALE